MDLLSKYKMSAANKLYQDRKQNFSQKELILKSYSRSADFLNEAIECLNQNKKIEYIENTNKAIIIIQNMLVNLNYFDKNGKKLIVAENLHNMYVFILETLRTGIKNKNTKNFDICIKYLNELHDTFEQIN